MAKQKKGKKGGAQQKMPNNTNNGGSRIKKKKSNPRRNNNDNDDDISFRNSLINQGKIILEMEADGNCLFRSLSDQLYHDNGMKHDLVRHDVCQHLSNNKEEFRHFLLMNDDDEDILDIEEYIEKIMEDGEWGGNVEIVVASRVYKRNVIVFSVEYDNGALSIMCEEKEANDSGDDLYLSYHGNDHYNSVHSINGGGSKKKKTQQSSNNTPIKNDQVNYTATTSLSANIEEEETKSRSRPPTRGSNCPCGSGRKYKKCCMAAEKSKKRLSKHLEKHKRHEEFIGDFKVLTI